MDKIPRAASFSAIVRVRFGAQSGRYPMVVFAARTFLDTTGRAAWPEVFRDEPLLWRGLERGNESIRATTASDAALEALLGEWAVCLKERFNSMYQQGCDRASLKRMADFMLCAARNRQLRWQAHLRYSLAQDPERIRLTFDAFTKNEFPAVPWDAYLGEIKNLSDVLRSIPSGNSRPPVESTGTPVGTKLRGIARLKAIDVRQSIAG